MPKMTADEAIDYIQNVCHDARSWRESAEAVAAIREAFAVLEEVEAKSSASAGGRDAQIKAMECARILRKVRARLEADDHAEDDR